MKELDPYAEWIAEGIWDVPAIESRDEFKYAIKVAMEQVVRETFRHVRANVSGGPAEVLRLWGLTALPQDLE